MWTRGLILTAAWLALTLAPVAMALADEPDVPATMPATTSAAVSVGMAAPASFGAPGGQGRVECVICHLSWSESFGRPGAVTLISRPTKPEAASEVTCLGCHDGSVGDSRKRVWRDHGHRVGVAPSQGMSVPAQLPLEDGKVACRTCHSAHSVAGEGEVDLGGTTFIRVKNDGGQLCTMCHDQQAQGPKAGSHPVGTVATPAPPELIQAGARAGKDNKQLSCMTCHTSHGAPQEHLLLVGTQGSELCTTCHAQSQPPAWRPNVAQDRTRFPPLATAAQRQAVRDMGTRAGPGDTLVCLSCHKVHQGQPGRNLLADTLEGSQFCLRCHEDRAGVLSTKHDLRQSDPKRTDASGRTVKESGPCGACHGFHSYSQKRQVQAADATGLCTSCHSTQAANGHGAALPMSHPAPVTAGKVPAGAKLTLYGPVNDKAGQETAAEKSLACLSCHDPHQSGPRQFLRAKSDDLCRQCHEGQFAKLAGGHDLTAKPEAKNGQDRTAAETGKCGFCHAVHKASGPRMWIATRAGPNSPRNPRNTDGLCAECHREGGLAAKKPMAKLNHPTGPKAVLNAAVVGAAATQPGPAVALPLFDAHGRPSASGFVTCSSCHDMHADSRTSPALLRAMPGQASLCLPCHAEQARLVGGAHDRTAATASWAANPAAQAGKADVCQSCHRAHASEAAQSLWAVAPSGSSAATSDALCQSCHAAIEWTPGNAPGSNAKAQLLKAKAVMHPRDLPTQGALAKAPEHLPMASDTKDGTQQLACKTCHDPHGGRELAHLARRSVDSTTSGVCADCHEEGRALARGLHRPEAIQPHIPQPKEAAACDLCHGIHAGRNRSLQKLWAGGESPEGPTAVERRCLACHGAGGKGKRPVQYEHRPIPSDWPRVAATQAAGRLAAGAGAALPTTMPAAAMQAASSGATAERITCLTCHWSHGKPTDAPEPKAGMDRMALAQVGAAKPMLRASVARELCASCHGYEGMHLFLYYHRPAKRGRL